ncbi:CHRD domain-containing protein [Lunatibacter salilacus]|uniref:CHRD domain-containing protein n=1 Tax=Lunatibacter salilacus TaxID=2483804 RepID=UPI00131B2DA1|nr:CHRD domain-containing protein [Lunatibacter salilacus]
MKNYLNSSITILAFFLLVSVILFGCEKDDDAGNDNIVEYQNIQITGGEEVPSNNSTATGVFNGTYDKTTKILTYTLTFTGLTPTNMHFHKGEIGVSGPVVIPISSAPYTSPINSMTPALTTEQESDLLNGLWYVNIHSAAFPPGEIRGQVD